MVSSAEQLVPILSKSIIDLQKAFLRDGLEGYDPGDIYHTRLGRLARKLWRKGAKFSFVVAAPLQIIDLIFPQIRYLVAEKRKEIGILKAIGAASGSITVVFFSVGMTIGVVGTLAGSAVGLTLIWVQNTYKVIRLAGDVYQIDYLPMKLTPSDFLLVVGSTLVLSFLATLFPARRAGALIPVDVLRYE